MVYPILRAYWKGAITVRKKIARRDWLKKTAGLAVGAAVGSGSAHGGMLRALSTAASLAPSRILNYNPSMGYRKLGRTDLWVSEIGLGGHYFYKGKEFMTQELRNEVVAASLESGINFFETTDTPGEDETTGEALRALGARKDVHVTHDFCDIRRGEWSREKAIQESNRSIETGLKNFHTDYLDIWRPSARQTGGTSLEVIEWVLEAGVKAKKEGKIRYLGLSCHNPKWLIQSIHAYPEFDMVIIPYNFLFRQAEKELFEIVAKKNLGMMTIKPFLAESLFKREVPQWAEEHDEESPQFEGEYKEENPGERHQPAGRKGPPVHPLATSNHGGRPGNVHPGRGEEQCTGRALETHPERRAARRTQRWRESSKEPLSPWIIQVPTRATLKASRRPGSREGAFLKLYEDQPQQGNQAQEPRLGCHAEPGIVGIGVVKGPSAERPVADINGRGPRSCACDRMRRPVPERSFPRQNATRRL